MSAKKLTPEQGEALRRIPAIEQLLSREPFLRMQEGYSRDLITEALRTVTAEIRRQILDSAETIEPPDESAYAGLVRAELESLTTPALRPIVNATGTITHTNLGRSLLGASASESLAQAAANYVNLEYDLNTGGTWTSRSNDGTPVATVDRMRSLNDSEQQRSSCATRIKHASARERGHCVPRRTHRNRRGVPQSPM